VSFTLPIGGNQDRRRARVERRSAARQTAPVPPSRAADA